MLTLSHVLKALAPTADYHVKHDFPIACGSVDSRSVGEKGLFVALKVPTMTIEGLTRAMVSGTSATAAAMCVNSSAATSARHAAPD